MIHSEFAAAALLKARVTGTKPAHDPAADAALSGATFLQQEPDLAKEAGLGDAGLRARDISGWAASGSPVGE